MDFALPEPEHGSDATFMETRAIRDGDDLFGFIKPDTLKGVTG